MFNNWLLWKKLFDMCDIEIMIVVEFSKECDRGWKIYSVWVRIFIVWEYWDRLN